MTAFVTLVRPIPRRYPGPPTAPQAPPAPPPRPRYVITWAPAGRLTMPFAPLPSDLDGLAATWEEVPRAGRTPLLFRTGNALPTMTHSPTIARLDGGPIDGLLDGLRNIAADGRACSVSYGSQERGLWRLVGLQITVVHRTPLNYAREAVASMTWRRASDPGKLIGPKRRSSSASKKDPPAKKKPKRKRYTVRKGDTLSKISLKVYGTGDRWRRIADANKIRDPRRLKVGQVLKIP